MVIELFNVTEHRTLYLNIGWWLFSCILGLWEKVQQFFSHLHFFFYSRGQLMHTDSNLELKPNIGYNPNL